MTNQSINIYHYSVMISHDWSTKFWSVMTDWWWLVLQIMIYQLFINYYWSGLNLNHDQSWLIHDQSWLTDDKSWLISQNSSIIIYCGLLTRSLPLFAAVLGSIPDPPRCLALVAVTDIHPESIQKRIQMINLGFRNLINMFLILLFALPHLILAQVALHKSNHVMTAVAQRSRKTFQ